MAFTDQARDKVRQNVDMRIVVSAAIGVALFGVTVWALKKTGVKPLKKAASVVNQ